MRKINSFFLIFCLLFSSFTNAQTIEICDELPAKYLYINGMYTKKEAAEINQSAISKKAEKQFELVYNRYDGYLVDLWEVFRLKLAEPSKAEDFTFGQMFDELLQGPLDGFVAEKPNAMQEASKEAYLKAHSKFVENTKASSYEDEPLLLMESQFKQLVKTGQLTWVVAHSQGNLYFPWLKERLVKNQGYDPERLFTIGLANPVANTYSAYFNDKKDVVLKVLSGFFPVLTAQFDNPNASFPYHDLQNTYLYGDALKRIQEVISNEEAYLNFLSRLREAVVFKMDTSAIYGPAIFINHHPTSAYVSATQRQWKMLCLDAQPGSYVIGASDIYLAPSLDWGRQTFNWLLDVNTNNSKSGQGSVAPSQLIPTENTTIISFDIIKKGFQRFVLFN